jgi:hypothetical protein
MRFDISGAALIGPEHLRMVLHLNIVDYAWYRLEGDASCEKPNVQAC